MKCKKCGTEFSEGIFCPMCGTKNEEVIIDQKEVVAIEKKEREKAEEAAKVAAKKKIEEEKEIIRNNAEKKAREEAVKAAQEKARQNISSDDEDIKSEALKRVREEAIQNAKLEEEMKQQEEAERKVKEERKINRKAIISLVLGIASWVGMLTVILPIVGGIWAIVDGCKALKGKTKYKKSAIFGIVLPILFYVLLIIVTVQDVVSESKRDAQLNSYIENGQYAEAREFIAQEYTVGSLSYVEQCADLYELQGMYDEAVDLWVEYCTNEYELADIPDFRINKINEYLYKYETDLKPKTVEKVYNLINNNELAKAEEQAAKEAEEQAAKEAEEQAAKEAEEQAAKEAEEQAAKEAEEQAAKEAEEQAAKEAEKQAAKEAEKQVMNKEDEEDTLTGNTVNFTNGEENWNYDEVNQMEGVPYDERGFYTIVDFPYQNAKQANKLIKLYKEILEANVSKFVTVEYERKSITNSSMQYKQTTSSSTYKYYGEMKNGLPDGMGCVVSYVSNYGVYMPEVLGNFKKGQLDGYAITFSKDILFAVSSEGNYKKGVADNEYVGYTSTSTNLEDIAYNGGGDLNLYDKYEDFIYERKDDVSIEEVLILTDIPLIPVYISETGMFKDGKAAGKWVFYYYNGTVRSEIKMDNNGETGKATIYYPDGTMQYTGEIKDGKYHGKGTLYREDGSVEYKGKFKNGNIDN